MVKTIVNGRVLYKEGEFKTADAGKVISMVAEAGKTIRTQLDF